MAAPVRGEEADEVISAFGLTDDQPVSTSHFPRVSSKTAENVTVITADDISRINAHTLSDVLQTVPGIQMDSMRTPGSFAFFNIQGALNTTVLVLVDGIRVNDLDQNMAIPGMIPVQQIERIEIIKGAASAAWGSALGGVVNIITKSPDPERQAAGMVSGSLGTRLSSDSRAELSGTIKDFGYYLTAGNLHSNGLLPNNQNNENNLYSKFIYHLPSNGTATFGLSYLTAKPGLDQVAIAGDNPVTYHDNFQHRRTNGFLKVSQPLAPRLSLDIDGHFSELDDHTKWGTLDNGVVAFSNDYNVRESGRGTDTRLTWGDNRQNLAAGFEYSHTLSRTSDLLHPGATDPRRNFDRYGVYANGAYSIGDLTILPGIREDFTGITGDNLSYTLGATYQLAASTLLRTYAAKGFSLPIISQQGALQKINTVQAGIETEAVTYLWLKGTYFYNTLRDSQSGGSNWTVTNQNRQGFEVESRTVPVAGFSLNSGYTFLYVTDADTGERLKTNSQQSVPPHNVKLALNYDNTIYGLRGALTGNYVWWNGAGSTASDKGTIWDLHLTWKVKPSSELSPEIFFSGHNLFDSNQTVDTVFATGAPRWFEGGVRYRF